MSNQRKSAILDLLNSSGLFDKLKASEYCLNLLDEMDCLDKKLTEELKTAGISAEIFEKYKDCYDKLLLECEDAAVLAVFKLGLKMGMEAGE